MTEPVSHLPTSCYVAVMTNRGTLTRSGLYVVPDDALADSRAEDVMAGLCSGRWTLGTCEVAGLLAERPDMPVAEEWRALVDGLQGDPYRTLAHQKQTHRK